MLPVNFLDRPLISDAIRKRQRLILRIADVATVAVLSRAFTPKDVLFSGAGTLGRLLGKLIAEQRATITHETSSAATLQRRM
jgi:hypothetical protein